MAAGVLSAQQSNRSVSKRIDTGTHSNIEHHHHLHIILTSYRRYLGFDALVSYNCSALKADNTVLQYNTTVQIDSWLNPVAIVLCYYTLAITAGPILHSRVSVVFYLIFVHFGFLSWLFSFVMWEFYFHFLLYTNNQPSCWIECYTY